MELHTFQLLITDAENISTVYTETWRQCVGDATGPSTTPTPTPTTGPTIAPGDATSSPDIIVASTQITINSDINCNGLRLNDIPDMDQTARDRVCKNVALCNEQGQWQVTNNVFLPYQKLLT